MSHYQLRLLGSYQLLDEGESAVGFRSEKERALLAYLAVEAYRPHSRQALAGLLWPDLPEEVAQNNLRVTLHRLRHALGETAADQPLLEVSRESIRLAQTGGFWIDVQAFQELLARVVRHSHEKLAVCPQCMDWYAQAAALYQGEFLQGVYPADCLPFSEWALLKREYLHTQALGALYLLTAYHQRRGELDQALGYARRQLELEPWREEAHCQVMTVLLLRGERSAALRQYQRCRQILWEELGVEPAQGTSGLYERILASRKRRRHNLPRQSTPFIGRKSELNRLGELLADPDCRLLTILGPGGIGKSRLACQTAEAQVYTHFHGVCLVSLASVSAPEDMLRAVVRALDLQINPARDLNAQLHDYLRQKEMLLVLDNFEQFLTPGKPSASGMLDDLLESAPRVRLLVTSRQRLNLSREQVFILQGLQFPDDILDPEAEKSEAVQLFLQRVRRVDPGFLRFGDDMASVTRVCSLLEGVPLAIELAAAWMRLMSPQQVALEIERDLDFLVSICSDIPERQRSLRATFEHSYRLLLPEEQRVLCGLSVFPAGFDRHAAGQVAGATLPVLSSLFDRSLLEQTDSKSNGAGTRYRMHQLIRQFSSEKLQQDPVEAMQAADRHRSYFMGFLNERNADVMGGTAAQRAAQEVAGEIDNVRLALERAIAAGNLDELGSSFNILMFFCEIQGLFEEAERIFSKISRRIEESIRSNLSTGDRVWISYGRALMYRGWYCIHASRTDQAIELTQKGMDICRQHGDLEGYGLGLNSLGIIAMDRGEYNQAKGYLQNALAVDADNGYTWAQAGALGNLGFLALMEGDPLLAAQYFNQGLDLHTSLDDEWGTAGDLDGLGDAALQQGDLDLAEQRFHQVLEIRQKHGQRWRVALSLNRLGVVAFRRRQYAEARQYYQESLSILRDFGERYYLATTLARYGEACTALGENEQARESLQQSLRLALETGADSITARALLHWAELLAREGETARAADILVAICNHPALEHEDRVKAEILLPELQPDLPLQLAQTAPGSQKIINLGDLGKEVLRTVR